MDSHACFRLSQTRTATKTRRKLTPLNLMENLDPTFQISNTIIPLTKINTSNSNMNTDSNASAAAKKRSPKNEVSFDTVTTNILTSNKTQQVKEHSNHISGLKVLTKISSFRFSDDSEYTYGTNNKSNSSNGKSVPSTPKSVRSAGSSTPKTTTNGTTVHLPHLMTSKSSGAINNKQKASPVIQEYDLSEETEKEYHVGKVDTSPR